MNKAYLITGASSGIGEVCARLLAEEGNTLVLVARNSEKLQKMKDELPGKIVPVVYDLTALENIKDIFNVCKEADVKLDGMVYSAGVNADCPIKVNNISLMQEAMTVNCFAFLEMGKYFYSKRYSKEGASVVAISSIASSLCEKGMAPYSASKAALNAIVKTMSKEFMRRKIRVNAVLPGGVDTPMASEKQSVLASLEGVGQNQLDKDIPQPLGMIPDTIIAKNVEFLLSDAAMYTTGELLTVSGGREF